MTKKITRIISLYLLCATWAGLAHAADTIRIAYSSVNPHALLVSLAEKRGLYAKYGLSSVVVYIPGGSTVIQAMLSGDVDLGQLTGPPGVAANLRGADILYDPGKSPNPAIDIGQLEGGYIQGVGFATTEELVYDEHGRLVTDNIWSYKPPCSRTIPLDFRVRLFKVDEQRNEQEALAEKQAVKSSKVRHHVLIS
jgi:hypothetical protein